MKEERKCPHCGETGIGNVVQPLSTDKIWICPYCDKEVEL